ncbi:hypothetical protein SAMN05660284_00476 [Formivibrio citricus]|uniref:Uncharacterized protein n=1 Tax=Formivibrio citricus TaxID=83765 RepID=A0A1I4W0V5_9NEIS|nr:hypothetical protein [Formivibrio citricus]SFN07045.1 hypothetical protein SAMN05660284_00476 [Formivibrio citricus]
MFYRIFVVLVAAGLLSFAWAQARGYSIFGSAASERIAKGAAGQRAYHK